jgi:hypothetical protein
MASFSFCFGAGCSLVEGMLLLAPPGSRPAHVVAFRMVGVEQLFECLAERTRTCSRLVEFKAAKLSAQEGWHV